MLLSVFVVLQLHFTEILYAGEADFSASLFFRLSLCVSPFGRLGGVGARSGARGAAMPKYFWGFTHDYFTL